MKKIATLTCILCIFISYAIGQSVSTPTAGTYLLSTNNQAASGFSVSGFSSGDNLLLSIGLNNPPSGTTLRLNTISGVTASVGYVLSTNFTRISFTGTQANINTVLSSLQVNTGATPGAINITVSATVNPTGYYYLPTNGHFYKPVDWPAGLTGGAEVYTTIKNSAAAETFKGQTGYLVTITSQDEQNFIHANVPGNNILIALTDEAQEGIWKWDAGPEAGTHIFTQSGVGGTTVGSHYTNWCSNEPNNAGAGENYTVTNWGEPIGNCWNDYGPPGSSFSGTIMGGYVVEFGTWNNPDDQTFDDFFSGSVTHQSHPPDPTSISVTAATICNGSNTQLTANGVQGTVYWYTGSCGGTEFTTGNTITVSPSTTTTYYARNYDNGQFSLGCAATTITVNPLQQFRSKSGGYWATAANWEQYTGVSDNWLTANEYPGQNSNSCPNPQVSIHAGHQMVIQTGNNIVIPNLDIKATGKLTVRSGGKIFVQDKLKLDESAGGAIVVE